jgi:hypothetical protein
MCDELYYRKLVLLVMKHIVFACYETCIFSAYFGGSPIEEADKTDSAKKTKQLTGHALAAGRLWAPIYSSVNRRIYRATYQSRGRGPTPLRSLATGHQRI